MMDDFEQNEMQNQELVNPTTEESKEIQEISVSQEQEENIASDNITEASLHAIGALSIKVTFLFAIV
ncbi:MAG: hypothetical protein K0R78_3228 [Pelosinus sp.]|nr:hypothetical protein [Pelosinus sp.]